MPNLFEDPDLTSDFAELLSYIPDPYYDISETRCPKICISSISENPLELPLTRNILRKLSNRASKSSFGLGTELKHDEKIRTSLELTSNEFSLPNFAESSAKS